jgi:hypothetical protein
VSRNRKRGTGVPEYMDDLQYRHCNGARKEYANAIDVEGIALNHFGRRHAPPDLIEIDVEDTEAVLRGNLGRRRPLAAAIGEESD